MKRTVKILMVVLIIGTLLCGAAGYEPACPVDDGYIELTTEYDYINMTVLATPSYGFYLGEAFDAYFVDEDNHAQERQYYVHKDHPERVMVRGQLLDATCDIYMTYRESSGALHVTKVYNHKIDKSLTPNDFINVVDSVAKSGWDS